jgi:hypothetical protein
MFQQVSIDTLLVAIAISCTTGTTQKILLTYALVCAVAYVLLAFIGGIMPIKTLITFELMVWVSIPTFLILLFINGWRYYLFNTAIDLALIGVWLGLIFIMLAYWIYDRQVITAKLWAKRIWFSQNDVLHIGLILWMIYIAAFVTHNVKDYIAY